MDGASPWQSFSQITLPLLMPQILIALLFRFAQSFGVFDLVQVMTGGGPAGSTENSVNLYLLYSNAPIWTWLRCGFSSSYFFVVNLGCGYYLIYC